MKTDLKQISAFFSYEREIVAVYLFGSKARGKATEKSDIDFGVILEEGFDHIARFDYKLKLTGQLEDLTGRRVDLVFMDRADQVLQHQIRKYGRIIFERDRGRRIAAEVLSRKKYFDYLLMHERYMEGLALKAGH